MRKILVPVDGSEDSLVAVREAIRQGNAAKSAEIHVLNVQPPAFVGETMIGMRPEQTDSYYYERSGRALASAEALLRMTELAFTSHRVVGPIVPSILDKQRELDCDSIVMSTQGHGRIAGALLGSVSSKVLHLAAVPVTLVKGPSGPDFTGRLGAT
ncbi:MAG TPA: universal stress protein [Burkholderiales bacterium]|nr:universal stress protein [Burkholderiales bacterium]